jgi:hypothetical protein
MEFAKIPMLESLKIFYNFKINKRAILGFLIGFKGKS